MAKLSKEEKTVLGKKAAEARWGKHRVTAAGARPGTICEAASATAVGLQRGKKRLTHRDVGFSFTRANRGQTGAI